MWAVHRDRLRTARAVGDLAARDAGGAAIEAFASVRSRCRRSTGSRCAGRDSAGLHLLRAGPRPRPRRPAIAPLLAGARATRCSAPGRCARPTAMLELRLQGGRGDRRAGRQHRGAARRDPRRRAAAPRARRRPTPRRRARPHAVGERRHHLRGQRAPAQTAEELEPATTRPVRGRRAQRRRRQLRRPQGRRRPAHPGRDHHRRQGDPDARRRAGWPTGASSIEAFRATVAELRGLGRHRAPASPPSPTSCCSRCGAAARRSTSGSPRTRSSSRASRTALVEETHALPAPRRRDAGRPRQPDASRGQVVVLDGDARRHARRASTALAYDGTALPVDRRRAADGRRSPPATSTAATSRTSCSRRSPRRRRRSARRCAGKIVERDGALAVRARRRDAARRRRATRLRDGRDPPGGRDRSGHRRRRRPEPGRARSTRRSPTTALRVEAMPATELSGLPAAARHDRHARRRDQPERHHHRHQPHRRPRARRGARR